MSSQPPHSRSGGAEGDLRFVEFTVQPGDVALIDELLTGQGWPAVIEQAPSENAPGVFRIQADILGNAADDAAGDEQSARQLQLQLKDLFTTWNQWLSKRVEDFRIVRVVRQDWAESWKLHFKPLRVGQRLIIKPSWEEVEVKPGVQVLELDPGMSFGTGNHGTTRACLILLEELNRQLGSGVSFLDVGCGSGILAMAAAALGYRPVTAFDYDPDSVRIARENIANCRSPLQIEVQQASLEDFSGSGRYRVVTANILALVLQENAARLVAWLDNAKEPGYLIVSGILDEQYADTRRVFEELGLVEIKSLLIEGWRSGSFIMQ